MPKVTQPEQTFDYCEYDGKNVDELAAFAGQELGRAGNFVTVLLASGEHTPIPAGWVLLRDEVGDLELVTGHKFAKWQARTV